MSGPNILQSVAIGVGAGLLYHLLNTSSEKKVELIENFQQCVEAVKILRKHCNEVPALGLDCEWVDAPYVSVLQLCSHKGYCAVIRLCKMESIPMSLCNLLSDRKVVKVGVGTAKDCEHLEECDLPTKSALDLRFVAKLTGAKAQNLAEMYKAVVGGTLKKDLELIRSDWEADTLTPQQIQYAADDAIAGIEIYKALANKVSDVKVFEKFYDMDYVPHWHNGLESVASDECCLQ
ncbi:exonuclease 3'-5' domain-containing protein 2-like [Bactrocera neohumeralis]|uniref:exonuclease 3'-5' domain-containing protein 2-like n=1 Tax=Bactrocera tryoni TaxID=59916 RepID=UPI001A97238D|nr:exonuclease 3'-5' domain-containing protein 2-like [Bactrocera tryoni]XP_050319600.1 exonuclease 3'-5' domain-containing protein 2-like [Bactrocera neohumeralis]